MYTLRKDSHSSVKSFFSNTQLNFLFQNAVFFLFMYISHMKSYFLPFFKPQRYFHLCLLFFCLQRHSVFCTFIFKAKVIHGHLTNWGCHVFRKDLVYDWALKIVLETAVFCWCQKNNKHLPFFRN